MTEPLRFMFDGEEITLAELSRKVTCYSKPWLADAVKAGCRSVRDLHIRFRASQKRVCQGRANGQKSFRKSKGDLDFRRLRTLD